MTKTVLVYGTGISGCGAADALAKQGCRVLLYSDKETKIDNALLELLKKQGGGLYCGNQSCWSQNTWCPSLHGAWFVKNAKSGK